MRQSRSHRRGQIALLTCLSALVSCNEPPSPTIDEVNTHAPRTLSKAALTDKISKHVTRAARSNHTPYIVVTRGTYEIFEKALADSRLADPLATSSLLIIDVADGAQSLGWDIGHVPAIIEVGADSLPNGRYTDSRLWPDDSEQLAELLRLFFSGLEPYDDISHPNLRLERAKKRVSQGKWAEAAADLLWCFDYGFALRGRYYLLGYLRRLGRFHPAIIDELRTRRDRLEQAIVAGRAVIDDAALYGMMSDQLNSQERAVKLIKDLAQQPAHADLRETLVRQIMDYLITHDRSDVVLQGAPTAAKDLLAELASPAHHGPSWRAYAADLFEAHARSGDVDTARKLALAFLEIRPGTEADHRLLEEMVERADLAGTDELAAEIRGRAKRALPKRNWTKPVKDAPLSVAARRRMHRLTDADPTTDGLVDLADTVPCPPGTERRFELLYGESHWCETPDGIKQGVSKRYLPNGTLMTRVTYVAGERHGRQTSWYPNGALAYDGHWLHGHSHGVAREWDENGTLTTERRFVHGYEIK